MAVRASMRTRTGRRAAIVLALCLASSAMQAAVDEDETLELEVKATYLYKLPPFIMWPADTFASPTSPFTLCVVGKDPFGDLLDKAVAGKRLNDRPVAVLRLDAAVRGTQCQLMYIASGSQAEPPALNAVAGLPVLTVTDSASEGAKGIVNFVVRDNHVRLEIDQAAAIRNRLDISSKLLSVAVSVTPK